MELSPHPEGHQPKPLAVPTLPSSQLFLHSPGRPSSACQEGSVAGVFTQGLKGYQEGSLTYRLKTLAAPGPAIVGCKDSQESKLRVPKIQDPPPF